MTFEQTRLRDEAWQVTEDPDTGAYRIERLEANTGENVYAHQFNNDLEATGYVLMAAANGDTAAIEAVDTVYPQTPPISVHRIKDIKRLGTNYIELGFETTYDASLIETELVDLKDRST